MLSSWQVSVQTVAPAWVPSRALAIYMLVFFGAMAAGSALWGAVARHAGSSTALVGAALGLVLLIPLCWRFELKPSREIDRSPSLHWPQPIVASAVEPDREPVLITLEYEVDPAKADVFVETMNEMDRIRRRNGAVSWGLFSDAENPRKWLEVFLDESYV